VEGILDLHPVVVATVREVLRQEGFALEEPGRHRAHRVQRTFVSTKRIAVVSFVALQA